MRKTFLINHLETNKIYKNIKETATGQGVECTPGCSLDYLCFKENYKLNAINNKSLVMQMIEITFRTNSIK